MKVGRKRETTTPLVWEPPYLGSQKSLVPDMIMELEGHTFLFDAKYKRHWEEFQGRSWGEIEEQVREAHRQDLLQVLAYGNVSDARFQVCCLVYPCSQATWESLRSRGRLFHKAEIPSRSRRTQVWLTAVPMSARTEQVAAPLVEEVLNLRRMAS